VKSSLGTVLQLEEMLFTVKYPLAVNMQANIMVVVFHGRFDRLSVADLPPLQARRSYRPHTWVRSGFVLCTEITHSFFDLPSAICTRFYCPFVPLLHSSLAFSESSWTSWHWKNFSTKKHSDRYVFS